MASVADDSMGSAALDFSLLQQQMLEHRQHEPSLPASAHLSAMSHVPEAIARSASARSLRGGSVDQDDSGLGGEERPETEDAAETRTTTRPPRLIASQSAPPIADVDNMAVHISSQRSWRTMRRAISLHGDEYGDTQSDSQMVRDFTESISHANVTPKKVIFNYSANIISPGENTYNTLGHVETQEDGGEAEADLVDLENALPAPTSPGGRSTTSDIEEELLQGPETQSQLVNGSAIVADRFPNTPSIAGNKRRRSGEMMTSEPGTTKKTPGFSQIFGFQSKAPAITATQLFEHTQAPSSPLPNAPRSDPVLTRPSPGMEQPQMFSSPGMFNSSPALTMHQTSMFPANEPREQYTSMRESQERRAARMRREQELQRLYALNGKSGKLDDDEEESEDTQQRRLESKRLQKVLSDQAMANWNALGAPLRPESRPSSSRKTTATIDLVTPYTTRKNVQFELSDGEMESDEEDKEMDLPIELEDAHDGEGVLDEEEHTSQNGDDIYDEFGETVLRSQRDLDEVDETEMFDDEECPSEAAAHVALGITAGRRRETSQLAASSHQEATVSVMTTTQLSAIADSQPDRLAKPHSSASERPAGSAQILSFVPGSQYAGIADQRETQFPTRIPDSTNRPGSPHLAPSREISDLSKVPSSPPVLLTGSGNDNLADAIRSPHSTTPARPGTRDRTSDGRTEVPESDMPDAGDSDATKATSISETAAETNDAPMFSTAPTHLSSQPTPLKPSLVKQLSRASASQQSSMPTPLKAAGVRRFADITAEQSPADLGSAVDLDAIMGGVFTAADHEYTDLLSSPQQLQPAKKRKLTASTSSRRATRQLSTMLAADNPPVNPVAVLPEASVTIAENDARINNVQEPIARPQPPQSSLLSSPPASAIAAEATLQHDEAHLLPASTPDDSGPPCTPESTRRREAQGANAASQLLARRGSRNGKVTKLSGTGRKTAVSRMLGDQAKSAKKATHTAALPARPTVPDGFNTDQDGIGTGVADYDAAESVDHVMTHVLPASIEAPEAAAAESPDIKAPNRVLALFRVSKYNAYYPATWFESSADGRSHHVRFDDQTELWVDSQEVRALDLRVGDVVKVDYPGFASKSWLVKAYGRLATSAKDRENGTDIYDRVTLKVQARAAARNSTTGSLAVGEGKLEEILITNIKLPHTLFVQLDARAFTPPAISVGLNRLATPTTSEHTSDSTTPTSRSRRTGVSALKSAGLQSSRLREGSVASSNALTGPGLFSGMAFAISYAHNETEKAEITRLIRQHGGQILDDGFDALFFSPLLDEPTTPSKRSPKKPASSPTAVLRLKPEYGDLGFVALIADKHSRRAKYVQALSLGIPTLHGRWILDIIAEHPKAVKLRPWTRYLLPAGESVYLNGAIRSRILLPYSASSARFADVLAARDLLLNGAGVLLVASKKGKATWERRRTYAFLTLAIGAGNVQRVSDLKEAKALLASEPGKWSWVYVDDEKVTEAAEVLFGKSGVKRRRGETGTTKKGHAVLSAGNAGVKVVGDEFVVQSLILGGLVE